VYVIGTGHSTQTAPDNHQGAHVQITDTQVHIWEAHRPDRPWSREHVGKPAFAPAPGHRAHRPEPLSAEEFIGAMDVAGVHRAIIVPPVSASFENLTALDAAARYPKRFAIMGRFDPTAASAREHLQHWREQPNMLGVRFTFNKAKNGPQLEGENLEWLWGELERLAIPVMMFVPGQLEATRRLAERHPGLTMILDHMARKGNLRDDECFADLDELLALARLPNVSVKASSVPAYSTQPYPFENLKPFLERIYNAFGPKRMMWGSDYTKLACSYEECVNHFRLTLDFMDEEGKAWVLGKTAAHLLGWPENAA
jgi:predicted TIM-barrel fold metal-dependent hydrolase